MLSERAHKALLDIRDNIRFAEEWSRGMSLEAFSNNRLIFYAVTRCLEIVSEASRRLPAELTNRHPHLGWRDIRDAGNIYRHDYDGVQERLILTTVRQSLPALAEAIEAEIARAGSA
jgi:uncharacterized protein with HEPN domain